MNQTPARHSIIRRLTVSLMTTVITVSAIASIIISHNVAKNGKAELENWADDTIIVFAKIFSETLWDFDLKKINVMGEAYIKDPRIAQLQIFNDQNQVLYETPKKGPVDVIVRTEDLVSHDRLIGKIKVAFSPESYQKGVRQVVLTIIIINTLILITIFVASGILIKLFYRKPLEHLTEIVNFYSLGNYSKSSQEIEYLEFIPFANVLSQMGEKITGQLREMKSLNSELERGSAELSQINQQLQHEIIEHKQSERALQQSEEKYRRIFEHMEEGYLRTSIDGIIHSMNPAGIRMLKYESIKDVEGKSLGDDKYILKNDRKELIKQLEKKRSLKNYLIRFKQRDGQTVIFESNIQMILDDNGQPFAIEGTFRDVTQRHKAEAELNRYKEHLEELILERTEQLQVEKEKAEASNRAKSTFIANMSHELRTPLNSILGFTQLMASDQDFPANYKRDVGIVQRAGEHLLKLINDVLEIAKIETGKITVARTSFNLDNFLKGIGDIFHSRATSKGLKFIIQKQSDLPLFIKTDEGKLRQTLINLLGNAIKYTEKGQIVMRTTAFSSQQEAEGRTMDAATLHFEVEDTGIGISKKTLKALFNPFVQGEEEFVKKSGTGLGLAISKQYTEILGGDMSVESELNKGSIFRFFIPIEIACESKEETPNCIIGLAPNQPTRQILIVEDLVENRLLLKRMLEYVGFEVIEAEDGLKGLEMFDACDPHLILMDIRMPKMDGYEAIRRIKQTEKGLNTPILVITAHAFEEERVEILKSGCEGFIRKPFKVNDVLEEVGKHLEIQYIFQDDEQAKQPIVSEIAKNPLSPEMLNQLPKELHDELRSAINMLEGQKAREVIKQINKYDHALAETLGKLAREFRFDLLNELFPDPTRSS